MVAIVSGNSLGLGLGSMGSLGSRGAYGNAVGGRSGEQAYVNAATGNLVLQDRDDSLIGHGVDVASVRTYNSQGKLNDDNADNWSAGFYAQQLKLSGGSVNSAASVLTRTDRDGAEAAYAYDSARQLYVSSAGGGAYDTIAYNATAAQYTWTDGDSGTTETYEGAATGRLLSRRDPSGNTLSYVYNAAGLIASVTDAGGEQTLYDYSAGNLTQIRTIVQNAGVAQTITRVHYTYDTANRLKTVSVDLTPADNAITDAKVYTTTYGYDGSSRRVASITQSDGTSQTYAYVLVGTDYRVQSVRDALGNVTSLSYDTALRRTSVTDPLGLVTRFDYDAAGQLTKVTAPSVGGTSQTSTFAYAASGDLIQMVDGEGRVVDMLYDNGNQTQQRDAAGNTVTRTYDSRNQLVTETLYAIADPDGAGPGLPSQPLTTRYVYDAGAKNLLRFVISAEGHVTEYGYNGYGERVASIQYAAAVYPTAGLAATTAPTEAQMAAWAAAQDRTKTQRSEMAYDLRGQLQQSISYGNVDAAGNGVVDAGRAVTQYVYDQCGLLLQTIAANGGTTVYNYDGLGRRLSATDAQGQVTLTRYDDAAGKVAVTLASGLVTTSAYDRAGRLVSVQQSSAASANLGKSRYVYDADSRLRMSEDPTGVRAWIFYDDAGRKSADVDATGTLTEYAYDQNDRLTRTTTYASAVGTATLVDAQGNPTSVALATLRPAASADDRNAWRAYDAAGRLVKTVDAAGAVVETTYDGASRVVKTTAYATVIATGSLGASPSATSIAPAASASGDRITRSFDDADGRLLATLDPEGYLAENLYDAAGRLTSVKRYATATVASLRTTGTLAQLRPAGAAGDIVQTFFYNAKGQVAAIVDAEYGLTEKAYDADGNLTQVVRYATRLSAMPAASAALASIRPAGNAEDQVTSWAYDSLDRVTAQVNAEGTETRYAYDSVGNLVATTQAYGTAEVRAINARFDVLGRLTGELTAEGAAQLTGGLTQAQIDSVWTRYGVSYRYDAAGRRISSTDAYANKTLFYYDLDGRLTQTIDALGGVTEQQYDAFGQLAASVRYATRLPAASLGTLSGGLGSAGLVAALSAVRNGTIDSQQRYTYNATGTVASSTDELDNTSADSYDAFGDRTGQLVALGGGATRTDTDTFDRRGLRIRSVDDATSSAAATRVMAYDAFGRLTQTIDANNNLRQQQFDRLGRIVQTVDATATRSTTYDAFDRVLTQTDGVGQTTRYAYSTSGRNVTVTTPEGIAVSTVHTRFGQTQSITDGNGQTTTYGYDRDGNLLSTATPLTLTTQAYDRADRLIETTDARGFKVAYTYDAASRLLTRRADPSGLNLVTTYGYDAEGRQLSVTDPRGAVTTSSYDRKGQVLTQVVDAGGLNLQTSWSYDARGKVLSVTDPAGTQTRYTYDALGRRVSETVDANGLNLVRGYAVDGNGNVVTVTDATGRQSQVTHDAADRPQYTIDAAGDATLTEYDAEGRIARVTRYARPIVGADASRLTSTAYVRSVVVATPGNDQVETRRYDRDGRLHYTVDGTGAVAEYRYDGNGNVVDRIGYANAIDMAAWNGSSDPVVRADAARDQRTRTVYDALNRAIFVSDGVGAVTQNTYDDNGNLVRQVRYATPIAAGEAASTVATSAADRVTSATYDAVGRETWRVDAGGAVTRTGYDAGGNAVKTIRYATPIAAGAAPSSVKTGTADRTTNRIFDKAGRLTDVADALGYVTRNSYDGDGRVTSTTRFALAVANGTSGANPAAAVANVGDHTDTFVYDRAGRLASSVDALGASEFHTYDGNGNELSFTNKKGSVWSYAYDAAGRRVQETSPQVALATVTTATTDASGKLVVDESRSASAAVVTQLGYDGLGNLTSRTEAFGRPEARTTRYEYDRAGRQVKVTYPPVAVYDESTAALAANGLTSLAARAEAAPVALSTVTGYDALGNAVANVDVAGSTSLKSYDAMGRIAYEVDALGFVTDYTRNAFGDAVAVTRYAVATGLAATAPPSAAAAPTAAAVTTVLAALDHSADRVLTTVYDKLGRVASVSEPLSFTYDSTTRQSGLAAKKTTSTYDAFGELVKTSVSRGVAASVDSYAYFDKAGRQLATVDALGYVTAHTYDAVDNVLSTTEYSAVLAAGSWNAATYTTPVARADDRTTRYAYDAANRKVSERRILVEHATQSSLTDTSDLVTSYGYDALGNLTRTTDATGASVFSAYDALGRVTAVTSPARASTLGGTVLAPLTTFRRDAYGNVVVSTEWAGGASGAAEFTGVSSAGVGANAGYTTAAASAEDRLTLSAFDALGHVRQSTDATAANRYFSYSARGDLAKTWQAVQANDQATTTLFKAYRYDRLGQLTHVYDPAPAVSSLGGASGNPAGLTDTAMSYDGFGELVSKGVNIGVDGSQQEYFDYDGAGHLWRSNTGDGVDKIFLYDRLGRQTSQIQSAGGVDDRDMHLIGSAEEAAELNTTRRTDLVYDALGRVISKVMPARADAKTAVRAVRQLNTASIVSSSVSYQNELEYDWSGSNRVDLSWSSLANLGLGDIRVELTYTTGRVQGLPPVDDGGNPTGPPAYTEGVTATRVQTYTAAQAAAGASLTWADEAVFQGGISAVSRFAVYKKDVQGSWQKVIDRSSTGASGNTIEVAAPADPATALTLQIRPTGRTAWTTYPTVNFGNSLWFDASALQAAGYDYQVLAAGPGQPSRVAASGQLALSAVPLGAITVPIGYASAGSSVLRWAAQPASTAETLRVRALGSTGAWRQLGVASQGGGWDGADTSALAAGTYEFELQWAHADTLEPYAHAIGQVNVAAGVPSYRVAATGVPNLSGIGIGSRAVGRTVINGLYWNVSGPAAASNLRSAFAYRVIGTTAWLSLPVASSSGVGWVGVAALPAASYEFAITYTDGGNATVALGTGRLNVSATVAGHYETRTVTVNETVTITPPDPADYWLGYEESGRARYSVPVFAGFDASGNPLLDNDNWPVLGPHYFWAGNTVLGVPYDVVQSHQETRQVWVDTTTAAPTVTVTTPPYVAAYTVAAVPKQYSASVSTSPNSSAISSPTSQFAALTLTALTSGDTPRITVPIAYQAPDSGVLQWAAQPSATTQAFRYRVAGATVWKTLAVAARGTDSQGVDTSALGAQTYEFELLWNRAGEAAAFAHATGIFVVSAQAAPIVVPPVGVPNVTGIGMGAKTVDGTNLMGLYWDAAAGTPTVSYRAVGATAWGTLTVTTAGGFGIASLAGLAAGDYEYAISYSSGNASTAVGSGTLSINAPGVAGAHLIRNDTVQTPVYGEVMVTPPDPSSFVVGSSRGTFGTSVRNALTNGPDYFFSSSPGAIVDGLDGDDIIWLGSTGNTVLNGGAGDDQLTISGYGGSNVVTFDGGTGNDTLHSNGLNFVALFGRGDGQDFVQRDAVTMSIPRFNTLQFKAGVAPSDVIVRRVNGFALNGDIEFSIAGSADKIQFSTFDPNQPTSAANMLQQVKFADGTTWNFTAIVAHISGSAAAPTLGTFGNDVMLGTSGDDYLSALSGDDTLDGGAGNDVLDGGAGNNTYLFGRGDGQDRISSTASSTAFVSTLQFKAGVTPSDIRVRQVRNSKNGQIDSLEVAIAGTDDKVSIDYYGSADATATPNVISRPYNPVQRFKFNDGTIWNLATIDALVDQGTSGSDRIYAVGPSTIDAGDGADLIDGSEYNDVLRGGAGDDQILGFGGDDTIEGGAGNDSLDGGSGSNTYLFGRGDGQDEIVGFTSGVNTLQFKAGIAPGDVVIRRVNKGVQNASFGYEVSIVGTTDRVRLGYSSISRIKFADNTIWDAAAIDAHVDTSLRPVYGAPVVTGVDANGFQILAPGYVWTDNAIVAVPYRGGYGVIGTTETQVATYGDFTVTTPAYTPGYTIAGAEYSVSIDAGDARLRPVVNQAYDRWGNVVESSDPRNAAWKTSYRYNANNQVVDEKRPDSTGALSASSPDTVTYYTALGQVAGVLDPLGNLERKSYDAGGNLVAETHADGGTVTHAYNAFNDKVSTTDAVGNASSTAATKADHTTAYQYDKAGRLTTTVHGAVDVWTVPAGPLWESELSGPLYLGLTALGRQNLAETYLYDAAGRKRQQTDAAGHVTQYGYDRDGNIVQTRKLASASSASTADVTSATFDAEGHQTGQTDPLHATTQWSYDHFGRLLTHRDLGNRDYTYTYDNARQLTSRTTAGQTLAYSYDAAGQLVQLTDSSLAQTTSYAYDAAGRHVLERTVQAGVTYQDNHLAYDALGRLRDVNDGRVHLSIDYDLAGNRTHIGSRVNVAPVGGASTVAATDNIQSSDRYFRYDAMNRQTVVDAVDAAGNIGHQGHNVTYDLDGNRTGDTHWGSKVTASGTAYTRSEGLTAELYGYDAADRLASVTRDGTLVDQRLYDAGGNLVQSGPDGTLAQGYVTALNQGSAQGQAIGSEVHRNRYDDQGRLVEQDILKPDWNRSDNPHASDYYRKAKVTYRYDAAGNLTQYLLHNEDGNDYTNTYAYRYAGYDGAYRQTQVDGTSQGTSRDTNFKPGTTVNRYDINGNLTLVDSTGSDNDRSLVNDAAGHALWANQPTGGQLDHVQRQLVVNGEVLGSYGTAIDPVTPRNNDSSPNFSQQADFNFSWQPVTGASPAPVTGSYSVRAGDTLKGIAQGAYGDSQLWYLIAEANGLGSDRDLQVGQTLTIPSKAATGHNNEQTVKPYDPSRISGDTTPNLAPASNGKGCGGLGTIIVIVVAIAVTVLTSGVAASALTSIAPGVFAGAGGVGLSAAGTVAAGAISAAAGSIASQAVGIELGLQENFSWKQVALSAISGGAGAEVNFLAEGTALAGSGFTATVTRAAITNAATQGIGIATGLQDRFNWKGIAASAVGAGVGSELNDGLGLTTNGRPTTGLDWTTRVLGGTTTGLAAGLTAATLRGGRVSAQQVAVDAFGNELGESIAAQAISGYSEAAMSSQEDMRDVAMADALGWTRSGADTGSGAGLRVPPALADSWGPQYRFDDPLTRSNYGLVGDRAARLGGPSYATVARGDTLEGLAGGDKEMMGRYIAGMGLRNPNRLQAGQSRAANWDMSADEALSLANRFYALDAQAKAAAASQLAARSAAAQTASIRIDPLASAYGMAASYPAYANEIAGYEQLRSLGVINDDKLRGLVLSSPRALASLRSDFEEAPSIVAGGPELRASTLASRPAATGIDLGVRAGTMQFQVAQQLPEALLTVGAPGLIPARLAGFFARAATATEGLLFGERAVLMSGLRAEMSGGLQADLAVTTGLAPETRSVLSQSAIRARVELNLAESASARAASRFNDPAIGLGAREWPPYPGTVGVVESDYTLLPKTLVDRLGPPRGSFLSPVGTSYGERALKPGTLSDDYFVYEVQRPLNVKVGEARSWFGEVGGGTQYRLDPIDGVRRSPSTLTVGDTPYLKEIFRGKYWGYRRQ